MQASAIIPNSSTVGKQTVSHGSHVGPAAAQVQECGFASRRKRRIRFTNTWDVPLLKAVLSNESVEYQMLMLRRIVKHRSASNML